VYLLGKGLPGDEVRMTQFPRQALTTRPQSQVKAMMEASLRGELTPEEERDTLQTSLEYLK
jgi:hypothetical protein